MTTIMPRKLNFTPSPPEPGLPYNIGNTDLGVNLTPTKRSASPPFPPLISSNETKDKGKKVICEPESEIEQYKIIGHTILAVTIQLTALKSICYRNC